MELKHVAAAVVSGADLGDAGWAPQICRQRASLDVPLWCVQAISMWGEWTWYGPPTTKELMREFSPSPELKERCEALRTVLRAEKERRIETASAQLTALELGGSCTAAEWMSASVAPKADFERAYALQKDLECVCAKIHTEREQFRIQCEAKIDTLIAAARAWLKKRPASTRNLKAAIRAIAD